MGEEPYYLKAEREAAEALRELLARPMPDPDCMGEVGRFDPWDLFPSLYGSYSSEFDDLALEVLADLLDGTHKRTDLAAEMFREMLCTANLCDYGTSPRVCFPTMQFRELLPDLITKWKAYVELAWAEQS